jgi:hypothetical protein
VASSFPNISTVFCHSKYDGDIFGCTSFTVGIYLKQTLISTTGMDQESKLLLIVGLDQKGFTKEATSGLVRFVSKDETRKSL